MIKTENKKNIFNLDERSFSVLVFSLFFSWLLAFPFEGKVLYAFLQKYQIDADNVIFESIVAHLIGLISCSFFVKNIKSAKRLIIISISACIVCASVFLFRTEFVWKFALILCSYLAGASVSAWGFYFKELSASNERIKIAADVLIFSNVFMIIINFIAINISVTAGIVISIVMLACSLIFALKLSDNYCKTQDGNFGNYSTMNIKKPLILLCIFIVVITVNSGLMYQVINPDFAHLQMLTSWYWALPYITAIYIMKNLTDKTNRTYILYVAIAMIGFSFIAFMILDRSVLSYLLIDTLMLGAFGVYDLFWWSIIGEMLDYTENPSKILGIGLSSNVLGVLIGGMTGSAIYNTGNSKLNSSVLALAILFIILIILPILHNQLSVLLKNHSYLTSVQEKEKKVMAREKYKASNELTDRENEIVDLLLNGRTYKMIAEELYLSENTVKTHIKNIYSKLNIKSKSELIKMLSEKTI